jgi:hypothetical protein
MTLDHVMPSSAIGNIMFSLTMFCHGFQRKSFQLLEYQVQLKTIPIPKSLKPIGLTDKFFIYLKMYAYLLRSVVQQLLFAHWFEHRRITIAQQASLDWRQGH